MTEAIKPTCCDECGTVLSVNGIGFVRQAYRVSRRSFDGTPIRGTVSRPTVKGPKFCRPCADARVTAARNVNRSVR